MDRVFVSYRRSDAEFLAAELQSRLAQELDAEVFFDLQSILPGDDWEAEITAALKHCSVFVLLLGRDWVGMQSGGKRRIDEEDDVFRIEMERALDSTAKIIPVLLGDVAVPKVSELPEGLHRIANFQVITIDSKHMEASINALIAAIRHGLERAHDVPLEDTNGLGDQLESRRTILDWDADPSVTPTDLLPSASTISMSAQLKLAVDSALVTARPLLLVGATGKARRQVGEDIARRLRYRYYEFYCTERTTSQDLIYTIDQTRRLADAQMGRIAEWSTYIEPGVLWWALDAESARRRGAPPDQRSGLPAIDPGRSIIPDPEAAVVAIHNLDRLEPFVIEQLFTVLSLRSFVVTELAMIVSASRSPHIILGVERTRMIPKWIRQQCSVGRLQEPSIEELASLARLRVGEEYAVLIDQMVESLNVDLAIATRFGTIDSSSFEDLLRAVLELGIKPGGPTWRVLLDIFGVE
jgi:hypothetical protein